MSTVNDAVDVGCCSSGLNWRNFRFDKRYSLLSGFNDKRVFLDCFFESESNSDVSLFKPGVGGHESIEILVWLSVRTIVRSK